MDTPGTLADVVAGLTRRARFGPKEDGAEAAELAGLGQQILRNRRRQKVFETLDMSEAARAENLRDIAEDLKELTERFEAARERWEKERQRLEAAALSALSAAEAKRERRRSRNLRQIEKAS